MALASRTTPILMSRSEAASVLAWHLVLEQLETVVLSATWSCHDLFPWTARDCRRAPPLLLSPNCICVGTVPWIFRDCRRLLEICTTLLVGTSGACSVSGSSLSLVLWWRASPCQTSWRSSQLSTESNSVLDLSSTLWSWTSSTNRFVPLEILTWDVVSWLWGDGIAISSPYWSRIFTIWTSITGPITVPTKNCCKDSRLWSCSRMCVLSCP